MYLGTMKRNAIKLDAWYRATGITFSNDRRSFALFLILGADGFDAWYGINAYETADV